MPDEEEKRRFVGRFGEKVKSQDKKNHVGRAHGQSEKKRPPSAREVPALVRT